MTTQEAKICPTCQFVETGDQDDHSCLDQLRKENSQLITDRAKLYDLLDRVKSITDEAIQFYVKHITDKSSIKESDSPDRVSDFRDALRYILEAKNTEGDCYEFVARLKAKADTALRKWGQIT